MQKITSKENSIIKHIIKLKEKKYRNEYQEFIVEGAKIVEEAINENADVKKIIISEDTINSELFRKHLNEKIKKFECIEVPKNIFKLISNVEQPQGILAIINKNQNKDINYSDDIIIALDDIQDPGNLGTIIRTVDSCNLKQILVSKGTVDAFNPKVLRSTMGAIFRVNIIECENWRWDPNRVSATNDHWLCQLHYSYNKEFINSPDFKDPYKQLDYCYEKYETNPKLRYWPNRKIKGKKCSDYVSNRFNISVS